jgi:hypothetical protein
MNDKNLKDMWKDMEYFMDTPQYFGSDIDRIIKRRSKSVSDKILNMLKLHIGIKMVSFIVLVIDSLVYFNVQRDIALICMTAAAILIPLIVFEYRTLHEFIDLSDFARSTKEKLTGMLTFLKNRSFITLLSTSTTYLFGYTAGILLYFFAEYGMLRRMGSLDVFVFPAICLIGIVLSYVMNDNTIKYQVKHLELCLSDFEDDVMAMVEREIEKQRKRDELVKLMVGVIVFLSLLVFIAVLKALGL